MSKKQSIPRSLSGPHEGLDIDLNLNALNHDEFALE